MHHLPYEIDCRECGCPDVEVERAPTPGEWFASGRARCNECGCVFSFRAPETEAEEVLDVNQVVAASRESVVERQVRCPFCRSTDVPVQHTEARIRYRKCQDCGRNFKGIVQ